MLSTAPGTTVKRPSRRWWETSQSRPAGSSSASVATAVGSGSVGRPATTPKPPSAARGAANAAASRSWRAATSVPVWTVPGGWPGTPRAAPTDSVLALMLVVGLTGGIGSGKSTVSRLLGERGAVIVDADVAARRVVEPGGPAYQAVVDRFGPGILAPDGAIDRPALAAIVFADPAARADLEAITHPAVGVLINEQLAAEAGTDHVVILDVPLLVSRGARAPPASSSSTARPRPPSCAWWSSGAWTRPTPGGGSWPRSAGRSASATPTW